MVRSIETTTIRIGVVAPVPYLPKIKSLMKRFPTFAPQWCGYEHLSEISTRVKQLMPEVEVLFFTGLIPYRIARESVPFTIPAHYVPLTGAGLYRSLLQLRLKMELQSISIDTLSLESTEHPLRDLGEPIIRFIAPDETMPSEPDSLFRFHLAQYRSGKSQAAITAVHDVSERLQSEGVPAAWLFPVDQDVIVSLERALLSTESRRSKEAQIVLGFIRVDEFNHQISRLGSEHEVQKRRIEISMLLLDYVETLNGHLTHFGGDEYLFVTTRGSFERETGGYKTMPLAADVQKRFGLTLSIGIGFGQSAGEAGSHARLALRQARGAGGNLCYIVREDGGVIGPLEMTRPKPFDLSLFDPSMLERLERGGMSTAYLMRLIAHAAHKGQVQFFANELASILGVTIRSVHRCLSLWLEQGLIEISGEDRSGGKGRPKQQYRFPFLADRLYFRDE
ncbi:GTP cyclohydrolase IIa [Cohnella endophytica]|uniref:GTP cyclohydrolase IIa n=1 Tax=Cohnella endophytica TaxID=2419778 RepID=A0A494XNN9_9BACL|nr:GTP cyclohydrolase IIa [Cohnella endophytica]RKP51392.1 GTP cyclohydrolase IIa [Cohnella endophytica]